MEMADSYIFCLGPSVHRAGGNKRGKRVLPGNASDEVWKDPKGCFFHELHTDHWNWHCHLIRGNVHDTFPGVLRDRYLMSVWPSFSKNECTVPFDVTEDSALTIAAARYKFVKGGGFL